MCQCTRQKGKVICMKKTEVYQQKNTVGDRKEFHESLAKIAIPVTLQSLLQSSFGVVDQVMTGQLGSVSIAGIGLGSKFSSLYSVLVSAIAAVAGIMIAQYIGKNDEKEVGRSFYVNLMMAFFLAAAFTCISGMFPKQIMSMYTEDEATREVAAQYLQIISVTYIPMAAATILSTLLRCKEVAKIPLFASMLSAVVNTGLNYVLIFGKIGFPALGAKGAAIATVIAQVFGFVLTFLLFLREYKKKEWKLPFEIRMNKSGVMQYAGILLPILLCEFLWSLGENVYASIYGHIGTGQCAAMTLTTPIQVLIIGALSGLAQAAGIMIGKSLGKNEYEKAYWESKKLLIYGLAGAAIISGVMVIFSPLYVLIYQVEESVRDVARHLLIVFALVAPVKVLNMILGGGIIRSGGRTKYVMVIDIIGTWGFGVPLGYIAAFVLELSITWVYFMLSLEECVRLLISFVVFKRKKWMCRL